MSADSEMFRPHVAMQVLDRTAQQLLVVGEQAEARVAALTKQASDLARAMVVIDDEAEAIAPLVEPARATDATDSAPAALFLVSAFVLATGKRCAWDAQGYRGAARCTGHIGGVEFAKPVDEFGLVAPSVQLTDGDADHLGNAFQGRPAGEHYGRALLPPIPSENHELDGTRR